MMLLSAVFASWVLLVSTTTTQCTGTACRPVGSALRSHPAATFATREACETFRQQIAPVTPMGEQGNASRPFVIQKDIRTLCQERKEE